MKIKKTVMEASERKLSTKWTVEEMQEIGHVLGDELRKEIDNEILNTIAGPMLVDDGWTQVHINGWYAIPNSWIVNNISGKFKCFGYYWYFEKESDATLFALRWS